MVKEVLSAYGLNANAIAIPFGNGLINHTWKVEDNGKTFILQKINTAVFRHPGFISANIQAVAAYLKKNYPFYFFCTPVTTTNNNDIVQIGENDFFRLFPYVENSHTIDVAVNTAQTFEAANMFGEFAKLLAHFPVDTLKVTLENFHNISLRYKDFLTAINSGNKERIQQSQQLIEFLKSQQHIVDEFEALKQSGALVQRVTHHDTKINNVLFNDAGKGICVIDLDTIMPGYFISDVGDMIRTYISPFGEEEKDFSKLEMREDYFTAIAEGYLSKMLQELNETELQHFVYAGKFMLYMQALRFLTDYLNNDVYYGSKYEGHNFVRAGNQAHLLQLLNEKEERFQSIVQQVASKKTDTIFS